jgi:hypothetical protein
MKFDAIEMMRSLSNRCYSDLEDIGASEGVYVGSKTSKVELICAIIANRAAKDRYNKTTNRKKYCLRCDDTDPYYLELTEEQKNLVEWSIDNEVCYQYATLDEMEDIDWETP